MSKKTDPVKQDRKYKRLILQQHQKIQFLSQVIDAVSLQEGGKPLIVEAVKTVREGADYRKERDEDIKQIVAIFEQSEN